MHRLDIRGGIAQRFRRASVAPAAARSSAAAARRPRTAAAPPPAPPPAQTPARPCEKS